jgi:CRP-like cAMP-binding protein
MKPMRAPSSLSRPVLLTALPKPSGFPLFRGLSASEAQQLEKHCVQQVFKPGEALFREGEPLKNVFLILKGQVKFCKKAAPGRGKEIAFSLFGEGDVFELMTSEAEEIHLFSGYAASETTALKVTPRDFRRHFLTNAHFATRLLYQKIRSLKVFYFSRLVSVEPVEIRMAYFLLELLRRPGMAHKEGKGAVLEIPLTRRDIAGIVNTTVETSIRVILKWSKKHLVSVHKRHLVIHDLSTFRKITKGLPFLPD